MPEKITDGLDGLGSSAMISFPAISVELRRWARKNEKVPATSKTTRSAMFQVSVANPDEKKEVPPTKAYMAMVV
ncbi:hypothetical protein Pmar_PMAR026363 [Perkinsus marinus ATCC 50983]|uniref:Uncharacterized protein n=1 Tax=Perkinsus marinus (strain ATCC 50983 / TXsc) TaxID=423536 RepID=C5LEJ3_PERM5|nr:hypothetical protein Pmar_PMAR026363 [Perkinsus marinus ATCC 50983]EER04811.1 hypothetical protein Pmar_PMAR026363 [Perkinsus marinus ATCC 50983]|eukprot:XP_002772995.1 hypothetical protein Pmar_PMAR026363 [Perkinsus marinus ATCC 50983]